MFGFAGRIGRIRFVVQVIAIWGTMIACILIYSRFIGHLTKPGVPSGFDVLFSLILIVFWSIATLSALCRRLHHIEVSGGLVGSGWSLPACFVLPLATVILALLPGKA